MTTELYACLYAREFPMQALLRLRPELREQPCVVMEGAVPLEQVCSLNTKARLLGMVRGMTRVEVDTFPASAVLPRSQKEEAATRAILLECAGAFSPRVEERSRDTAFVCGIDIAGTRSLFGPPETLARKLLERVRAVGISASVTISSNLHAAVCIARGLPSSATVKVIPQGEEAAALAELPCAVLDLVSGAGGDIYRVGPTHARHAGGAAGKGSRRAYGPGGPQALATGARPAAASFSTCRAAAYAGRAHGARFSRGTAGLAAVCRRSHAQSAHRSRQCTPGCAGCGHLTLTLERGGTHARTVRPALPTNDKQLWIKLLHLDLEAHPPPSSVLAVALDVEPGATSKVQPGLFSPQLPEASRLDVTLARIRAVVGEENVGRAALLDTYAPDAFKIEALKIDVSRVTKGNAETTDQAELRAAARQLRPAESVTVTLEAQRPTQFYFRGQSYSVDRAYGPWLVSGDWWQPTLWGHEQWDIVARAGDSSLLCCCLVRDRMHGGWQMAALYD